MLKERETLSVNKAEHKSRWVSVKEVRSRLTQSPDSELEEPLPAPATSQFMVPYVSYAQDEFSSSVQGIFFLAAFYTEDVDLAKMTSCGNVFGVWGEGNRPGINYGGEHKDKGWI